MVEILNYRNSLPLDSMLCEYRLESILGAGGFGMTYLAYDTNLEKRVAIKEYLPVELAVRTSDGTIVPVSSGTEYNYTWGLERFLQEARLLAKFSHPNIVAVNRYFEANRTAYMVMNYESGESLSQMLKRTTQPDEALLMRILAPLLDGLHAVHVAGFLHRDIKPSNIFIRDKGAPLLIDFGSARLAIGGMVRTMTSILTPGYSPLEQYAKDGNQGPWTDIYALAAVLYRTVTGDNPPDVVTRLKDDTIMETLTAARDRYSAGFLHAIKRGLQIDEEKRPQSVPEWRALIAGDDYTAPAPPVAGIVSVPVAGATVPDDDATVPVDDAPTLRVEKAATNPVLGRKPSMLQLTSFAAGALALFLVVGGVQLFETRSGTKPAKSGGGKGEPAVAGRGTLPKLTPREFYLLDRDRSGYLTRDEIRGDPLIEDNFARIDSNNDARISLEEFTSFP